MPNDSSSVLVGSIWDWAPFAIGFIVLLGMHRGVWWLLLRDKSMSPERRLPRQLLLIAIAAVGAVVLLVLVPTTEKGFLTDQTKGNLLGLLGLMAAAILTLSATTVAANAIAGLMLRMQAGFRPGDFVQVQDNFGRVTERGLFHTEIQTEARDLLTLPNTYLASHPVRVVRSSGTIITAEVSLGYDVSHHHASKLLTEAAASIGLGDPFVWIIDLKDHAVCYRVCGFHEDMKTLVSIRSKLRGAILDTLHGAGVEIVSPSFMAQRPAPSDEPVIPTRRAPAERDQAAAEEPAPEERVFDKAEVAERKEALVTEKRELEERAGQLEELKRSASKEAQTAQVVAELDRARARIEEIEREVEKIDSSETKD